MTELVSELEAVYERALAGHRFTETQAIYALRLFRKGLIERDVYDDFRAQDRAAVARAGEARNRLRRENEQARQR